MDIVMPKMGESVSEGTILKWHKNKGDRVKRDEIIFEISTDKVDTEIPSPAEGVLSEIRYNEGDTVEVGTVVAVVDSGDGENTNTGSGNDASSEVKYEAKQAHVAAVNEREGEKEKTPETKSEIKPEPAGAGEKETKDFSGGLIDIKMPKMGESVMEGTIIKWHKKVGEKVKKDEVMFEISTDKVDTEVPSPSNGTVAEILVAEQETVEVGTVVAKLAVNELKGSGSSNDILKEKEAAPGEEQKIETAPEKEIKNGNESAVVPSNGKGNVSEPGASKFLSPLVMNIAKKENVSYSELEKIVGTGTDGRITKKDILAYIEERSSMPKPEAKKAMEQTSVSPKQETPVHYEPSYSDDDVEKMPMDNIRQKIMQHMINSRDTSVHVTAMLEVDMTKIHNFIQSNKEQYLKSDNVKLTYLPFIAYATVKALKEFPLVNSSIEGTTIIRKKFINLGIAVAIEPAGLIVPNIKHADDKNIIGLAKSINDVAGRARNKKLTPDDITNGTFTITNYGVFGTIFGTPIINQPEVAILGVGTVAKKPVVIEVDGTDTIAVKPIGVLTLSHDHRLIDGMIGGKFLKAIKDNLENFNKSNI